VLAGVDPLDVTRTTLHKPWIRKMMIFAGIALILGSWGLYDAVYLYPKRGREDVGYKQFKYLEQSQLAGRLASASVEDPRERLDALDEQARVGTGLDPLGQAKRAWLVALKRVSMLEPQHSTIAQPDEKLRELQKVWSARDKPSELAFYDLPFQWFVTFAGFGGLAWVVVKIMRARARVYTWDRATLKLTLPGGRAITPADLTEVDKRKWHKFFVTLVTKAGSPVALDLLKYYPLEEWVLEMERAAFPETADAGGEAEPSETPAQAT
jgi:hypothetical protein